MVGTVPISVQEAEDIILAQAKPSPAEFCPIGHAIGRVLREDIRCDRPQPPLDKSLMDGIAVSSLQLRKGRRLFRIQAVVPAGHAKTNLKDDTACFQVMTGAPLPRGCDVVIPVEEVDIKDGTAHIRGELVFKPGQFIRQQGADVQKGQVILSKGLRLSAPHIGVAAGVGKTKLKVSRRPQLAIVATGDELVDVGRPVRPYQTRLSSSYALHSLFQQSQLAIPKAFHLPDQPRILKVRLKEILNRCEILVLTGGVSMGEFDYVPAVLNELGVNGLFHKVAQKPGKPFWFGKTRKGQPVFALPGNPISTLVCCYKYVLCYLKKVAGLPTSIPLITLRRRPDLDSSFTHFLFVKDGEVVSTGGSGDFAAVSRGDGFIQYDPNNPDHIWPYFSWRF